MKYWYNDDWPTFGFYFISPPVKKYGWHSKSSLFKSSTGSKIQKAVLDK